MREKPRPENAAVTDLSLTPERLSYLSLMREIEDFFHAEADLLDEREYDRWLELLTEDIVYWMPMRRNVSWHNRDEDITAENDMAWMHDDKETLRKRVKQIQTGKLVEEDHKKAVEIRAYLEGLAANSLAEGRTLLEQGFAHRALEGTADFRGAKPPFPSEADIQKLVEEIEALPSFKNEVKGGEIFAEAEELEGEGEFTKAFEQYKTVVKTCADAKIVVPARAAAERLIKDGMPGFKKACNSCRSAKRACAKHKEEMKAIDSVMDELEGKLLAHLNDLGVDSLKAGGGVVYTQQELQASIADKGALSDYIRTSGEVELLQGRVSSGVLKEWMNAHPGELPPGVAVRVERVIRVRSN